MNCVCIRAIARMASTLALVAMTTCAHRGCTGHEGGRARQGAGSEDRGLRRVRLLACHSPVKHCTTPASIRDRVQQLSRGTAVHLADPKARPATKTDLASAAAATEPVPVVCQMYCIAPRASRRSRPSVPAPDPAYDLLMTRTLTASTICRAGTRSRCSISSSSIAHSVAASEPRSPGAIRGSGDFKVWDLPSTCIRQQRSKDIRPGTAAAANPVCLSCKTQDTSSTGVHGRPRPAPNGAHVEGGGACAVHEHALNCIFCHDRMHEAQDRRDALIEAVLRTDGPQHCTRRMRARRSGVKDMACAPHAQVGLLERYDGKLHADSVTSNTTAPGFNRTPEKRLRCGQANQLLPFVDVNNILKAYDGIQFRDFATSSPARRYGRAASGVETITTRSTRRRHRLRRVPMPKVKDAKTGKLYTSHWQTNRRTT